MNSYVTDTYYFYTYNGKILKDNVLRNLKDASLHINTLTFNRIVGIGFENLTDFQKEIIREVVCRLAEFEYENADLLQTPLSNYSINGVAMGFNEKWNVQIQNGIAIPKKDYCLLGQTGLTCRNLRC